MNDSLNRTVRVVLISLVITGCRPSDPGPPASGARGSQSTAVLERHAEAGDVQAQRELAVQLLESATKHEHFETIAKWLQKAAERQDAQALYLLGELHEAGRGLPPDDSKAAECYKKAAELGYGKAQYAYGLQCALGKGIPKDKEASVKWLTAAALQGIPDAQFNLAQRFEFGQGVATQLAEAYRWNLIAGRAGIPDALQASERIGRQLTPAERKLIEKQAAEWRPMRAEAGQTQPSPK